MEIERKWNRLCEYCIVFEFFQLASPVQDELGGLARFEIGRIDINGMLNTESDVSLEMRILLQSISLDDIRQHSTLAVKRCGTTNNQLVCDIF